MSQLHHRSPVHRGKVDSADCTKMLDLLSERLLRKWQGRPRLPGNGHKAHV